VMAQLSEQGGVLVVHARVQRHAQFFPFLFSYRVAIRHLTVWSIWLAPLCAVWLSKPLSRLSRTLFSFVFFCSKNILASYPYHQYK
jgi:hypothetical protein